MLTLHYFPGNASLTPHMVLEELGVPFELALVDRTADQQHSPAYLKLNPTGRIPTLVDGDLVVCETAAIVLHLLDRHDGSGRLAPPVGTAERAKFYQWVIYMTNTVQAEYRGYFYPGERTTDPAAAPGIKARSEARLDAMFDLVEQALEPGPYLLGGQFSAADLYLLMLVRWSRGMTRPARTLPRLGRHAELVLARGAVQRAFETEGIGAPFV